MNFFDRFKNISLTQDSVEPQVQTEKTIGDKIEEFFEPVTEKLDSLLNGSDSNNSSQQEVISPTIEGHTVEVYTLSYCGWCKKAKSVLDSFDVQYTEHQLDDPSIATTSAACQSEVFKIIDNMLTESGTTLDHKMVTDMFTEIYGNPSLFDDTKSDEELADIIENSENRELLTEIIENLETHQEILPALEYFMEAEGKCELNFTEAQKMHQIVVDEFTKFTEDNQTGNFVPQIIVDGRYFGGFQEISECPKTHGNIDSCFNAFIDNSAPVVALTI